MIYTGGGPLIRLSAFFVDEQVPKEYDVNVFAPEGLTHERGSL